MPGTADVDRVAANAALNRRRSLGRNRARIDKLAVRAMRAGAMQFLEKPVRENELWEAIRDALRVDAAVRQTWLQRRGIELDMVGGEYVAAASASRSTAIAWSPM